MNIWEKVILIVIIVGIIGQGIFLHYLGLI